jgi:predicted DsbA family dithiol-disulfide isomerase
MTMKKLFKIFCLSIIFLIPFSILAQDNSGVPADQTISPYRDFFPMKHPVDPSVDPDKKQMDIIYFFSYSNASDFNDVDKAFEDWASKVPSQINPIITIVNTGQKNDYYDAFLFFGLQQQGKEQQVHRDLISAITSGLRYTDLNGVLLPWLGNHGVDVTQFQKDVSDNVVKNLVLRTPQVAQMYEIESVPSVVVDGKIVIPYQKGMSPQRYITIVNTVITFLWQEKQSKVKKDVVL